MNGCLTSDVGKGEAPLGRAAVCVEHQQQLMAARGDRHCALPPTPRPQQGGVLSSAIEGIQAVVVTAAGQAAPSLQLQVQEEDFDAVAWGQLDAPLTPEVVGVVYRDVMYQDVERCIGTGVSCINKGNVCTGTRRIGR